MKKQLSLPVLILSLAFSCLPMQISFAMEKSRKKKRENMVIQEMESPEKEQNAEQSNSVSKWPEVIAEQIEENDFGETIPLPETLEEYADNHGVKIVQLKANRQSGDTCTFEVFSNARGVELCINNGERIVAENIAEWTKTCWMPLFEKNVSILEKLGVMKKRGLGHCYISKNGDVLYPKVTSMIGLEKLYNVDFNRCLTASGVPLYEKEYSSCCITEGGNPIAKMSNLCDLLRESKEKDTIFFPLSVSFVCDYSEGLHAFYIAYIKVPDQKPLFIYMESNNLPLDKGHIALANIYRCLRFLINPDDQVTRLLDYLLNLTAQLGPMLEDNYYSPGKAEEDCKGVEERRELFSPDDKGKSLRDKVRYLARNVQNKDTINDVLRVLLESKAYEEHSKIFIYDGKPVKYELIALTTNLLKAIKEDGDDIRESLEILKSKASEIEGLKGIIAEFE